MISRLNLPAISWGIWLSIVILLFLPDAVKAQTGNFDRKLGSDAESHASDENRKEQGSQPSGIKDPTAEKPHLSFPLESVTPRQLGIPKTPRLLRPANGVTYSGPQWRGVGFIVHFAGMMDLNTSYWEICWSLVRSTTSCGQGNSSNTQTRRVNTQIHNIGRRFTAQGSYPLPMGEVMYWTMRSCNNPTKCSAWAPMWQFTLPGIRAGEGFPVNDEPLPVPDE